MPLGLVFGSSVPCIAAGRPPEIDIPYIPDDTPDAFCA